MIRIDEIYENTFWHWMKQNIPTTRMWFCDPPGTSARENLKLLSQNENDQYYIYFHDQEPIYSDIHSEIFDALITKNFDIYPIHHSQKKKTGIVTSEYNSASLDYVCSNFEYTPYYYFYHGWAALDWYRGYDKTFLMAEPKDRHIEHSFISANRIIGGRRDHRILLFFQLQYHNVKNALISFPKTCPVENIEAVDIAKKFEPTYSKIVATIKQAELPWNFPEEQDHPMASCWLDLFDISSKCLATLVTETSYFGKKNHLTEKTFKPICMKMPFIIASNAHSLKYLRKYGFKTFGDYWDESYDDEDNDYFRLGKLSKVCETLDKMNIKQLNELKNAVQPVVEHNFNHFYSGAFENILWEEMQDMLGQMKNDFCV